MARAREREREHPQHPQREYTPRFPTCLGRRRICPVSHVWPVSSQFRSCELGTGLPARRRVWEARSCAGKRVRVPSPHRPAITPQRRGLKGELHLRARSVPHITAGTITICTFYTRIRARARGRAPAGLSRRLGSTTPHHHTRHLRTTALSNNLPFTTSTDAMLISYRVR